MDRAIKAECYKIDLQHGVVNLRQHAKSTAQNFTNLYTHIDRQKNSMQSKHKYSQAALETFNILAQLAAQDLKPQIIDPKIMQQIDKNQLSRINANT